RQHKYHVISVVLNFTGPEQPREFDTRDPDLDGAGIHLRVFQVTMREQDAGETLARIAADPTLRAVLPVGPLMRRGDEAGIIEEWKRLAQAEPDQRRRSDYAGLALVFAELTNRRPLWAQALEGWNVKTSQQVLEWQADRQRIDLLRLMGLRVRVPVPGGLVHRINQLTLPGPLAPWCCSGGATA